MLSVFFEVIPFPEGTETYFDLAAELKESLEKVDGFISIERFQSLADKDKYLSLSFWQNEEAILHWKQNLKHQMAQEQGKTSLFKYYRIRVAEVLRDYDFSD